MATDKQVNYALSLLDKAGYSTNYMNSGFKDFGATMRERSGKVEDWVRKMSATRASTLIDTVKKKLGPETLVRGQRVSADVGPLPTVPTKRKAKPRKTTPQRFTVRVRRGLVWVSRAATASYEAQLNADFTPEQRDDVEAALRWVTENAMAVREQQVFERQSRRRTRTNAR